MEALPWIISTAAVLAVLLMVCLSGAKRRPAGGSPKTARRRATAAKTRAAVRKATRANLDRIAGAMEADNAEELLADEVNRLKDRQQ